MLSMQCIHWQRTCGSLPSIREYGYLTMCMTAWQRGQLDYRVFNSSKAMVCRSQSTQARHVSDKVLTSASMQKSLSCAPDIHVHGRQR